MIKSEEKIRFLLSKLPDILIFAKQTIEEMNAEDSYLYTDSVKSLQIIAELKQEVGFIEDKSETRLKQTKINF